jgi:hypothetical protein
MRLAFETLFLLGVYGAVLAARRRGRVSLLAMKPRSRRRPGLFAREVAGALTEPI